MLEAEILQYAHEYKQSLKIYERITREKIARKDITHEIWMNMGVLSHELGQYDESMKYFRNAATKLKESSKSESISNYEIVEDCNKEIFCTENGTWIHCTLAFNIARVSIHLKSFA